MTESLRSDDRGISTAVSHVLAIGITSVLVVSLLFAAGSYLQDQREIVAEQEMRTIGNRIANELSQLDELSKRGGNVSIVSRHPEQISGNRYNVRVETGQECETPRLDVEQCLVVFSTELGVNQRVPLDNVTDLRVSRIGNGRFLLQSDPDPDVTKEIATLNESRVFEMSMRPGIGQNVVQQTPGGALNPNNRPPIPRFTFEPGAPHSGNTISFDAGEARDPDGAIAEYWWRFNESYTNSTSTPQYSFSYDGDPGLYNVTLNVTDNRGVEAAITRNISVSGLEYNNDMNTLGTNNDISFTMENSWDEPGTSYSVTIEELRIDPIDDVPDYLYAGSDKEIDITSTSSDDTDVSSSIPSGGLVVRGLSADISSGSDGTFTIRGFDENMDGRSVEIAVRHRVNDGTPGGHMNTTVFRGVVGGVQITRLDLVRSGQDVDLVIEASEQLQVIDVDLGADASGSLDETDFTETDLGGTYEYVADVSSGTAGSFEATLQQVENAAGSGSGQTPLSDQLTFGAGGFTWETAADWDGAESESGVVHASYGDRQADRLELGYNTTQNGLVGYWSFDEDSGSTANDHSGTGNDGSFAGPGQPVLGYTGVFGNDAYVFEPESNMGSPYDPEEWIEVPDDSSLEMSTTDEVTVSMWVNQEEDQDDWRALLQHSDQSYNLQLANGGEPEFTIYDGTWVSARTNTDLTHGDWTHLVGTFDGSQVRLYVDGGLEGTAGGASEISDASGFDLGIGENLDENGRYFDGRIDEVRLYDRALSSGEVTELYETVSEGELTTDWRTDSNIPHTQLRLDYTAFVEFQEIDVRVLSDPDGDGVAEETSDTVTIDEFNDGTGELAVTGLSSPSDTYRLEVTLNNPAWDPTRESPSVDRLQLCRAASCP